MRGSDVAPIAWAGRPQGATSELGEFLDLIDFEPTPPDSPVAPPPCFLPSLLANSDGPLRRSALLSPGGGRGWRVRFSGEELPRGTWYSRRAPERFFVACNGRRCASIAAAFARLDAASAARAASKARAVQLTELLTFVQTNEVARMSHEATWVEDRAPAPAPEGALGEAGVVPDTEGASASDELQLELLGSPG